MTPRTLLRDLNCALDDLHVAASNAALDHVTHGRKDTAATWANALRFVDVARYTCALLAEARQVLRDATGNDADALRRAERRLREIALTYQPDFTNTGDTDDHTYH